MGKGGGIVHLLNRQPAHLNDTGNLKQTLGSSSQKIVFLLLLSMTKTNICFEESEASKCFSVAVD